jgi:hypothetical protein
LLMWSALSDERAVCSLHLLLSLAIAVILESESRGTHNHILLSHMRLSQPGGLVSRIYVPQEQGGPVIPPGTGFPLHRLSPLSHACCMPSSVYDKGQTVMSFAPTTHTTVEAMCHV